MTDKSVAKL
jgi:hypothetical protein